MSSSISPAKTKDRLGNPPAEDIPFPEIGRSRFVFPLTLALVVVALRWPEMPPQFLLGILAAGMGALMAWAPPEARVGRFLSVMAAGFVMASAAGFLPRSLASLPGWRLEVEALGQPTGPCIFVQPALAAEAWAIFAATALVVVYLLGHRLDHNRHHSWLMAFVCVVAAWTVWAMASQPKGGTFGFFPNRNHTATLLAMAVPAGFGCLVQGIRNRQAWRIGVTVAATAVCIFALMVRSESRAGVLLFAVAMLAWIPSLGKKKLKGHAARAVFLALGATVGAFLIADTKVKDRIEKTAEAAKTALPASTGPQPFEKIRDTEPVGEPQPIDGRISIWHDTLDMLCGEPWSGAGPGQFARVIPQYRRECSLANSSSCLHPESDWLWMATEAGLAATGCLGAALVWLGWKAGRSAWKNRGRSLRVGSLVAAFLVPVHGILDVPGHRIGLALAAAWLAAIALRFPQPRADGPAIQPSFWSRLGWRGVGLVLAATGVLLLQAGWTGKAVLPSARVAVLENEVRTLFAQDRLAYEQATKEAKSYQPAPADDPLERALVLLDEALRIAPLDPDLQYMRGAFAAFFDDKGEWVERSFALERRLDPTIVALPLRQADVMGADHPADVKALWDETLKRARAQQALFPETGFGPEPTFQRILEHAGRMEGGPSLVLDLAVSTPDLLPVWARNAPQKTLDAEMPDLLRQIQPSPLRRMLIDIWRRRGSRDAFTTFEKASAPQPQPRPGSSPSPGRE